MHEAELNTIDLPGLAGPAIEDGLVYTPDWFSRQYPANIEMT
jgi:hypothetical protein